MSRCLAGQITRILIQALLTSKLQLQPLWCPVSEECPPGGQERASEPGVNYDAASLKATSPESPHLRDQGLWANRLRRCCPTPALDQTEVTLSL